MKGREIINHIVRAKMPDREQVFANCLRQTAPEKQKMKRPIYRRSLAAIATAAVLVICFLFGNVLLTPPNSSNSFFAMSAYAMVQQEDGSVVLHEFDLLNPTENGEIYSGFRFDGEILYINIGVGIKIEGDNIKSVELVANNNDFFATQNIIRQNGNIYTHEVPMVYMGVDNTNTHIIVVYGSEFEHVGNRIMLDENVMTEDFLLFLARTQESSLDLDLTASFRAVITFSNGEKVEQDIIMPISRSSGVVTPTETDRAIMEEERLKSPWRFIPLEDCEVIPESVKTLGEPDEYGTLYMFEATQNSAPMVIIEQDIANIDETGIYRSGWMIDLDGSGIMLVVKRDENGVLTGMVYRVPPEVVSAMR